MTKGKSWKPIFVTQSSGATRIGMAQSTSQIKQSGSLWHDFFFGAVSNPKQNPKIHTHKKE